MEQAVPPRRAMEAFSRAGHRSPADLCRSVSVRVPSVCPCQLLPASPKPKTSLRYLRFLAPFQNETIRHENGWGCKIARLNSNNLHRSKRYDRAILQAHARKRTLLLINSPLRNSAALRCSGRGAIRMPSDARRTPPARPRTPTNG